jgi:hypothetical protein
MLLKMGARDATTLQSMSTDDKRNTLIVVLSEVANAPIA